MIVVDTSIAIAALSPWHDRSAEAADRCRGGRPNPRAADGPCGGNSTHPRSRVSGGWEQL